MKKESPNLLKTLHDDVESVFINAGATNADAQAVMLALFAMSCVETNMAAKAYKRVVMDAYNTALKLKLEEIRNGLNSN